MSMRLSEIFGQICCRRSVGLRMTKVVRCVDPPLIPRLSGSPARRGPSTIRTLFADSSRISDTVNSVNEARRHKISRVRSFLTRCLIPVPLTAARALAAPWPNAAVGSRAFPGEPAVARTDSLGEIFLNESGSTHQRILRREVVRQCSHMWRPEIKPPPNAWVDNKSCILVRLLQ